MTQITHRVDDETGHPAQTTYAAMIYERGNGFAGVGDYVSTADGEVYRVVHTYGPIHTDDSVRGNYIHAVVTDADWSDVDDDTEPYCSAIVDHDSAIVTD